MSERKSFATEKEIWWELDKICVSESALGNGNYDKSRLNAIENCMRVLTKPTHGECKIMYDNGY